jgi:hypothetical protein
MGPVNGEVKNQEAGRKSTGQIYNIFREPQKNCSTKAKNDGKKQAHN